MTIDLPHGAFTQIAYALATVADDLRALDESKQRLVVMVGPGATNTVARARRFHDAVSILSAYAGLVELTAQHEDEVFTVLAARLRGDDLRQICTPVSASPEPSEPAVVVALTASEAA